MKKEIIKSTPEKTLLENGHVFISEEKITWHINFKKIISQIKRINQKFRKIVYEKN